jgi:hypothetical protein
MPFFASWPFTSIHFKCYLRSVYLLKRTADQKKAAGKLAEFRLDTRPESGVSDEIV